jgi:ABC-type glycerol-3-phosphate transport system permease component
MIVMVIAIYPIFNIFNTSFRTGDEVVRDPFGLPKSIRIESYLDVWIKARFNKYFLNSLIISCSSTIITLLLSSLAAYPLAKLRFRGEKFIFYLFMVGIIIPIHARIVPIFHVAKDLGIMDSLTGVVLIYQGMDVPFAIFILRAYLMGIPNELLDAARIDGCPEFSIYRRIILPLIKPAITSLAVILFLGCWNDYLIPVILLFSDENRTLPIGITYTLGKWGPVASSYPLTAAGAVITSLPIMVLYAVLNKQFIRGMVAGALKR